MYKVMTNKQLAYEFKNKGESFVKEENNENEFKYVQNYIKLIIHLIFTSIGEICY